MIAIRSTNLFSRPLHGLRIRGRPIPAMNRWAIFNRPLNADSEAPTFWANQKEGALYYEQKENGLGIIFLDEIDATVERILRFPHSWHPMSARTRRCRTHRFPFGLLYQVRSNEILITAVMDLRRDPKRWRELI